MLTYNANINELNYDGRILYYARHYEVSEFGGYEWTEFWLDKPKTIMQRRWFIIGPLEEVVVTKCDFKILYDICDASYTKEDVRASINYALRLYNREEEIKNGKII